MPTDRVIRIEAVRFDPLDGTFAGTAILRAPGGTVHRRRLTAPGDPAWTHDTAVSALAEQAHNT
ncbi:hypothetical protein ACK8OR_16080 [Jannaschia sp. KMU-145]|uniref:hypothetical protein n=1 Tax=Jannaschia halovivens TaxID=3388667 RepID=UPI00396AFBB1